MITTIINTCIGSFPSRRRFFIDSHRILILDVSIKMIKTFKVKHNTDFSNELEKAKSVALFTLKTHCTSSSQVKQFGLKSIIANQIIRKIVRNKKIKTIKNVNLIIPSQGISFKEAIIYIPSLKLKIPFYLKNILKINQIELNSEWAFVNCEVQNQDVIPSTQFLGIDLNTTGHMAVVANPVSGKVWKLNKKSQHIRKKYKQIRQRLQKKRQFKTLKQIKNREKRIIKDLDHKASTFIVSKAKELGLGIRLENLRNIRKSKTAKSFKGALNSWSFYQLKQMIEYKSKLQGVLVEYIDPRYTSQADSRSGHLGQRNGKVFKTTTNVVEHADVNAAFNIALNQLNIVQLRAERDVRKRCGKYPKTDTPQKAISNKS